MAKDSGSNVTTFTMRIPKDMVIFLKKTAAVQEESMSSIVMRCLDKYRKKLEAKVTQ
ncbi:hypothetical protein CCP3SC1AL1_1170015 [Gammaproteobacteria bacterium]